MTDYVLFGVNSADIETARRWVEESLALKGEARTNNHNGNYYTFEDAIGLEFKLINGICSDEDGPYPAEAEFPDWKVLLYADQVQAHSPQITVLEKLSKKFVKLRTMTI